MTQLRPQPARGRLALATLLGFLLTATARAATFSEGRAAYDDNHVADAERIYAQVIVDKSANAADRASAERELARIAWLIDGNSKRALGHLAVAHAIGDKACDTAAMTARVLREA